MSGRTLVITNDFPPRPGGIQSFVHGLIVRQPADSIVVFAPTWGGDDQFDEQQPFPVIRYPRSLMLPTPGVRKWAQQLVRSQNCDRVLFGATAPLGLMSKGLRGAGAEHIVGITHGHEAAWSITPGGRSAMRRIGANTDTITFLGEYTRERIGAAIGLAAAARMRRLVPGVEADTFSPANSADGQVLRERYGLADRKVIVCVSRLMPRKGQDTLIHALPQIRQRVPEAALLIVGGGPYRGKLQSMIDKTHQNADIVMTGSVPFSELPAHYAAGDVFSMPCRTRNRGLDVEGLGIVYLEASATGIPVVAGESGGAPDAVIPGETGFVVPGGSPAAAAARITEILLDPALAQKMGSAGRQWVESTWSWPLIAARLTRLLDGVDPDL